MTSETQMTEEQNIALYKRMNEIIGEVADMPEAWQVMLFASAACSVQKRIIDRTKPDLQNKILNQLADAVSFKAAGETVADCMEKISRLLWGYTSKGKI
jgi:hypothetical protein